MASIERDARAVPRRGARRRPSATGSSRTARRWRFVYRKLGATLEASQRPWRADHGPGRATYASAAEFLADLRLVQDEPARATAASGSPRAGSGRSSARPGSSASTSRPSTCASTRERHTSALAEVFGRYGLAPATPAMAEDERARAPHREIRRGRPLAPHRLDFSPETNETLELFRLMRRAHERVGPPRSRPTSSA